MAPVVALWTIYLWISMFTRFDIFLTLLCIEYLISDLMLYYLSLRMFRTRTTDRGGLKFTEMRYKQKYQK